MLQEAAAAEILIRQRAYALLVLDLATAGHDGLHLLRWTQQTRTVGTVLVLTESAAIAAERSKGTGLETADWLVKPFSFTELSARVRGLLRRPLPRDRWHDCARELGA